MFPMPGHEEQMEEFKYLAFLSYTARHSKNLSKKTKKIIGWTLLGIVTIVSVLLLWKFVAANPTIAVQPVENDNWYFARLSDDMNAANRLKDAGYISSYRTGHLLSGYGIDEIIAYTDGQTNRQTISQQIASEIAKGGIGGFTKLCEFKRPLSTATFYAVYSRIKNRTYLVRLIITEIPTKTDTPAGKVYYSSALVLPKGLFSKETIKAKAGAYPQFIHVRKLNENNVSKFTLFESKVARSDNVIYIYDLPQIIITRSSMELKYASADTEQNLYRWILKIPGENVWFAGSR
jgi:hypothetical protein